MKKNEYEIKKQSLKKEHNDNLKDLKTKIKEENLSFEQKKKELDMTYLADKKTYSSFENTPKRIELNLPKYTKGEELFNAISHIVGGFFGLIAGIIGIYYSYINIGLGMSICMAFYMFSMIFLYSMSSIYHFLFVNKAKKVFQVMDHCTIYVLIIGTYTPICYYSLNNIYPYNYLVLSIVVLLGIIGIVFNSIMMDKLAIKILSNSLYLIIGWLIIFFYVPLSETIPLSGLLLIIFGGISYTIGAILYGIGKSKRYFHSIFHMFVLLGTVLQYLGILLYVIL